MSSAVGGGAEFYEPGPQLVQIMDASGGSAWGIAREVWRGYEGQRSRLFVNWAGRLRAAWASAELPDNTSYGFYRRHSSILRASLSFAWIFPTASAILAIVAAELLARRRSSQLVTWFAERSSDHATLAVFTLLLMIALTVVHPQARYRLFVVPAAIVYSSFALVAAGRWIASRRWPQLAGLAGATVLFAALQAWISEPHANVEDRYVDYTVAGSIYRKRGNDAAADEYFRRRVIDPARVTPERSPAS
jgi:hypothetical protein